MRTKLPFYVPSESFNIVAGYAVVLTFLFAYYAYLFFSIPDAKPPQVQAFRYYVLGMDKRPYAIDEDEWTRAFGEMSVADRSEANRLRHERVGDFQVTTKFLMVVPIDQPVGQHFATYLTDSAGKYAGMSKTHATWDEAVAGHDALVVYAKNSTGR